MTDQTPAPPRLKPIVLVLSQGCANKELRPAIFGNSQAEPQPGDRWEPQQAACAGIGYFNRRTTRLALEDMDGMVTSHMLELNPSESWEPDDVADSSSVTEAWNRVFEAAFELTEEDLARCQYVLVRDSDYDTHEEAVSYLQKAAARKIGRPLGLILLYKGYAVTEPPA